MKKINNILLIAFGLLPLTANADTKADSLLLKEFEHCFLAPQNPFDISTQPISNYSDAQASFESFCTGKFWADPNPNFKFPSGGHFDLRNYENMYSYYFSQSSIQQELEETNLKAATQWFNERLATLRTRCSDPSAQGKTQQAIERFSSKATILPDFYSTIKEKYNGDVKAYVADLYAKTKLMKPQGIKGSLRKYMVNRDIGVKFLNACKGYEMMLNNTLRVDQLLDRIAPKLDTQNPFDEQLSSIMNLYYSTRGLDLESEAAFSHVKQLLASTSIKDTPENREAVRKSLLLSDGSIAPIFEADINRQANGDVDKYVSYIFSNSMLTQQSVRNQFLHSRNKAYGVHDTGLRYSVLHAYSLALGKQMAMK